ncbi:hypothetical protein [Nocardia vinacea]|uniref:hypothetical protein n=1 Tax=Nocardia vinacea TaxID=96468 RepID=UPI001C3F253A|nr:hypothetical protein [Nocardia vinacea]
MADGRVRVGAVDYARRVNAAADLLATGLSVAEVVAALADRFGCSTRQARRYAGRAVREGQVTVPGESVVFTVKLPAVLAGRVRDRARASQITISALVALALTEFLARGPGQLRRR